MSFIRKEFRGLTVAGVAGALVLLGPVTPSSAEKPLGNEVTTSLPSVGKRTITVPSDCPGPNCPEGLEPHAQGLRTVYLNFDGVTLTKINSANESATNNQSAIVRQSMTIAPFNPNDLSYTGNFSTRAELINGVVDLIKDLHAPYNIVWTTERPTSGPYQMVVFGGSCQSVVGESGCAGIALLDCGDFVNGNITFVFPPGLRWYDLATTTAQENAHAYGLAHTDDEDDVMYPYVQQQIPSGFGAGNVPDNSGGCLGGATYQDSHQQMLSIIGPAGQDTLGPEVTITQPAPGAAVFVGSVVSATAVDLQNAVAWVSLEIDGEEIRRLESGPYDFAIPNGIEPGERIVTVRSGDTQGNTGFDRITVFMTDGSETPCDNDNDCPDGFECSSNVCVPDNGIDGELGDACTTNEECQSGACATLGDESRCSQGCDEATACPDGFDCIDNVACWPADGGGGGGGCDTSGGSSGTATALLLLLGAALLTRRYRCF